MVFKLFKGKKEKKPHFEVQTTVCEEKDQAPDEVEMENESQEQTDPPEQLNDENKDIKPAEIPPGDRETQSGLMGRLRLGLSKTRKILTTDIDELFSGKNKIDDELLEDLEAVLITSDMGVETTMDLMEKLSKKSRKLSTADELKSALKEEIVSLMQDTPPPPETGHHKPFVIMVVGINGVGKTTTIGKLAEKFRKAGKKTLIAASDTFRAAATEQLGVWADRSGAEFVKGRDKADPAAVAYDAVEAAVARDVDVVLIDTAGRLHTNVNLMEELKKIKRASSKRLSEAPHHILLVLDATTGQNALSQANLFNDALGITGIALTKLDGTAKGGIVVSICSNLRIPLQFIGIGEKIEDLQEFDPDKFVDALF